VSNIIGRAIGAVMEDKKVPSKVIWADSDFKKKVTLPKSFQSHLKKSKPKILYHYTSQEGLLGIVAKSELWATKVQYMNDATEFGIALKIADECLSERLGQTNVSEHQRRLKKFQKQTALITNLNIFVSCFCEKGDLLSQWRAYTGMSHGYSLGIKTASLKKLCKPHEFALGECIYEKARQKKIIEEMIALSLMLPSDEECVGHFSFSLVAVGAFFKDALFSEEQEWRLVSSATSIMNKNVGFRTGKSMINPFYKFQLGIASESAIDHVYIGPCPHSELSKRSVKMLLRNSNISCANENLGIRNSQVPYRDW
jgi:hypothetical protein